MHFHTCPLHAYWVHLAIWCWDLTLQCSGHQLGGCTCFSMSQVHTLLPLTGSITQLVFENVPLLKVQRYCNICM